MYIRNITGASTQPCGTLLVTALHPDMLSFITVLICRSFWKSLAHSRWLPFRPPICSNFHSNRLWGTLSKAFSRSRYTQSAQPCPSCVTSITLSKLVTHHFSLLNPNWPSLRVPTASRYCVHLSFNIFQSSGTLLSCKDWLNILVRGWSICCLSSFNNCGNMVSGPVDLFGLSLSRYFFTLWLHVVSISRGDPPLWVRALRNGTDVLNHEYGCEIKVDVVSEWPIQLFSGSVGVMPWRLHSESPGSIPRSCCTFQDFSVCYCSFSNEGDWCFLLGRIFICALNFFNSILWCSVSQHTTEAKQRQCSFVHSRHLGSWMEW